MDKSGLHNGNKTQDMLQEDILSLAKGGGSNLVIRAASMGLMFLAQVFFARFLGPTDYGLFAVGWAFVQIGGRLGPLGLQMGVVKFGAEVLDEDRDLYSTFVTNILLLSLGIGVGIGGGLFFLSPIIAKLFNGQNIEPVLRIVASVISMYIFLRVTAACLRAAKRVFLYTLIEDFIPAFFMLAGALSINLISELTLYTSLLITAGSYLISSLIGILIVKFLYPETFKSMSREEKTVSYKTILKYSLPISATGAFAFLSQKVTRILIAYFLPFADAGIYQAASQIAVFPTIVLISLSSMFSPLIPTLVENGRREYFNELYKVNTKWGVYLSFPLFLVLLTYPSQVLQTSYGSDYAGGGIILAVLALGQLANTMSGAVGVILNMTGNQKKWMAATGISFFITILLTVIGILQFGLLGAAMGSSVGIAFMYGIGIIQVRQNLRIFPYDLRYWKGVLAGSLSLLSLFLLSNIEFTGMVLPLLAAIVTSYGVFASVLFFAGVDKEDEILFKHLVNILKE